MPYHQPFEIIGFHSCDKNIGIDILNGKADLKPSNNPWDWLADGIYFWEQNPARALDCAVIKYVHLTAKKDNMPEYNSVRCAFAEGKEAYPSSNFIAQLHIQICLRQSEFIKGYFLPRPIEKYNPYL